MGFAAVGVGIVSPYIIALTKDDLDQMSIAIQTSRRFLRVIQFNIAFAMLLKAVFLVMGVTGHTSLWLAILADSGTTVLVVMNALHLLSIKSE